MIAASKKNVWAIKQLMLASADVSLRDLDVSFNDMPGSTVMELLAGSDCFDCLYALVFTRKGVVFGRQEIENAIMKSY